MSCTAILSLFLVSCLALPEIDATPCPSGEVGDARIQCSDPGNSCVCTLIGDPHLAQYTGMMTTLLLPCVHVISQFTMDNASFCNVRIEGAARYSHSRSFAAREDTVEILVSEAFSHFFTRIVKGELPEEDNNGYPLSSVTTTMDNVTVVSVPECGLEVKFDANNGLVAVVSDFNSYKTLFPPGLCDNCKNGRSASPGHLDHFQALQLELNSLRVLSSYDGKNLNHYGGCQDLGDTNSRCPSRQHEAALKVCGSMLVTPTMRDCLLNKLNDTMLVVENFKSCYERACSANRMSCYYFYTLFYPCDFSDIPELQDPDFCVPLQ